MKSEKQIAASREAIKAASEARNAGSPWRDERVVERMKALIGQGLSNSKTAALLAAEFPDYAFTGSAVIGIRHRLGMGMSADAVLISRGLGGKLATRSPQAPAVPKRTQGGSMGGSHMVANRVKAIVKLATGPTAPPPRADTLKPTVSSLLELRPCCCKWPYGDADFRFCGRPAPEGRPYCESHAALAVTKPWPNRPHSASELARSLRRHL